MWSGDGGDVGYSSEEEDDDLQTRVQIKEPVIKSRGHDDYDCQECPVCDVRKHFSCTCDNDGLPSPPPRLVAATACIAYVFAVPTF